MSLISKSSNNYTEIYVFKLTYNFWKDFKSGQIFRKKYNFLQYSEISKLPDSI